MRGSGQDLRPMHPRDALFEAQEQLPALPVCDHYAGVEVRMRKSLELQAELGPVFDVTLDAEDGAHLRPQARREGADRDGAVGGDEAAIVEVVTAGEEAVALLEHLRVGDAALLRVLEQVGESFSLGGVGGGDVGEGAHVHREGVDQQ